MKPSVGNKKVILSNNQGVEVKDRTEIITIITEKYDVLYRQRKPLTIKMLERTVTSVNYVNQFILDDNPSRNFS